MRRIINEIIESAIKNNIDTEIIKRLLKPSILNNKNSVYILKKLFNGMTDKYVLELFSIIFINNYIKLNDYLKYEEVLKKCVNYFYISYRNSPIFSEIKVCLLFNLISRFNDSEETIHSLLNANLLELDVEEFKFRSQIFLLLKSVDNTYSYINEYLKGTYKVKTILEDTNIPLIKRIIFFNLIKTNKIFINEKLYLAIYKRLNESGFASALYLSIALSKEEIRENEFYLEFVIDEENISILPLVLELLETNLLNKKEIKLLNFMCVAEKELYLKELRKNNKEVIKATRRNENKILEGLYHGFVNDTLTLKEYHKELNLIRKRD